jgi:hypothetical protein
MASVVKETKRKAGVVLKSKTSGVINGAEMVDVKRKTHEGVFSVQVATEPEMPEGVKGFYADWFKQYIIDGLLLEVKYLKTKNECAQNAMAEYVICLETGTGFKKYGFYQRVFVNSDGAIDNSDGDKSGDNVHYLNLWTGAVDSTCNFESPTVWARSKKVWFSTQQDLPKIQYVLGAEAYQVYCREWNGWMALYHCTNKELKLEVCVLFVLVIIFV